LALRSIFPFFRSNNHRHSGPPRNSNMKYATEEKVVASVPHPILPTVQGKTDYQTIHTIRKLLQANARAIDTHLGGGALGHLGLIVSDASYAIIAPTGDNGSILWTNPTAPGYAPAVLDQGMSAQLSAIRHSCEEAVLTYRTFNMVQQALKKKIITVFETIVKLLPLLQPPVRARTDSRTNPSAQRATQLRSVLACVYPVSIQNQITTTVP
jgi:hypothetical protein